MTESFKQQLQELINQAAEKFDERNNQETDYYCPYSFKQGCEFLMPLIESLIEIRDNYIEYRGLTEILSELIIRNNKDLLNLIKEKK